MKMIIRQEQNIKKTEASSTMQCAAGSDRWKVVGVGRTEVAEPANGIQSYGVCDGKWVSTYREIQAGRNVSFHRDRYLQGQCH